MLLSKDPDVYIVEGNNAIQNAKKNRPKKKQPKSYCPVTGIRSASNKNNNNPNKKK